MSTVHVVPLHDSVQHTVALDVVLAEWEQNTGPGRWLAVELLPHEQEQPCACGPTPELVPNPDGPDGWVVTHHSLDGREQDE